MMNTWDGDVPHLSRSANSGINASGRGPQYGTLKKFDFIVVRAYPRNAA